MLSTKSMAIFEPKFERKVTLDDTETLSCTIETAQKVDGHTAYVLKLQRGPLKENCWRLLRRYNDFVELHKCLVISGILLPLPGKKFIGNMRPEFIAERRQALQEYINTVLMNPILASSLPAKKFVDPESYNQSFLEIAIQNASLCLRTEGIYALGPSLGAIGWRLRKHYFKVTVKSQNQKNASEKNAGRHLVKSGSQSHSKQQGTTSNGNAAAAGGSGTSTVDIQNSADSEFTLTWTEFGPDKYIDDKEVHNVFKNLAGIQHPYIQPIDYVATNDSGALVIRKFHSKGSIKDLLCGSVPKNPFLSKYGNPKGRTPLPLKDVAIYGRQVLEALRFLHSKGMPFGHIHAGNVVIVDGVARLLDIENFFLGVPSFYRPFFVQHSKIYTVEVIDVYSFGHWLFEMSMGYPLQESIARQPIDCSDSLKQLLESILSKEACKVGLPTLDQLASHKFFTEHAGRFNEQYASASAQIKPHLKFSTVAKEQIKIAVQRTEQRLRDEQKSVKNQKRLVRVQEMMSSEEEKKKIKHKAKLEHKQSKLRQQNSLQLNNMQSAVSQSISRSDSIHSVSTGQSSLCSPPPQGKPSSPIPQTVAALPAAASSSSTTTTTSGAISAMQLPSNKGEIASLQEQSNERSALLNSISNFNKSALRKVASSD